MSVALVEVLLEFEPPVSATGNRIYHARACGALAADGTGRWHGWIEFLPLGDGTPIRTARETTQPNRTSAMHWATRLRPLYLRVALERALEHAPVERTPIE